MGGRLEMSPRRQPDHSHRDLSRAGGESASNEERDRERDSSRGDRDRKSSPPRTLSASAAVASLRRKSPPPRKAPNSPNSWWNELTRSHILFRGAIETQRNDTRNA